MPPFCGHQSQKRGWKSLYDNSLIGKNSSNDSPAPFLPEAEADILIDLARLRAATGAADEAQRLAEETLLIADRSGYVLQGADAHLELAKLAKDKPTAREHAQQAKTLATCDGPPDYTYQAAYDEAVALLKQLG